MRWLRRRRLPQAVDRSSTWIGPPIVRSVSFLQPRIFQDLISQARDVIIFGASGVILDVFRDPATGRGDATVP